MDDHKTAYEKVRQHLAPARTNRKATRDKLMLQLEQCLEDLPRNTHASARRYRALREAAEQLYCELYRAHEFGIGLMHNEYYTDEFIEERGLRGELEEHHEKRWDAYLDLEDADQSGDVPPSRGKARH